MLSLCKRIGEVWRTRKSTTKLYDRRGQKVLLAQAEIPPLVSLYALINKMRVVSNLGIAERADKVVRIIVDTYALPNKSFQEVRAMMESGALDPLRDFSEACHEELSRLSSQALQYRQA